MILYFNTYRNPFRLDQTLNGLISAADADFPIKFSYGSKFGYKPLVNEVSFGDGYAQRSSSGIVKSQVSVQLVFDKRRDLIVAALRRFFMGDLTSTIYNRSPEEYFYMALPAPMDDDITRVGLRKFVLDDFNAVPEQFNSTNVTVSLREWFGS